MVDRDPIEPVLEKLKTLREHLEIAEADTYPGGPPAWDSGNFRWAAGVCGELESLLGSARLQKEEGEATRVDVGQPQASDPAGSTAASNELASARLRAMWKLTARIDQNIVQLRPKDIAGSIGRITAEIRGHLAALSPSVGESTSEGSVSVNPERKEGDLGAHGPDAGVGSGGATAGKV